MPGVGRRRAKSDRTGAWICQGGRASGGRREGKLQVRIEVSRLLEKNVWQMESPSCHTPRTFMVRYNSWIRAGWFILVTFLSVSPLLAGEADIKIPALDNVHFGGLPGMAILY